MATCSRAPIIRRRVNLCHIEDNTSRSASSIFKTVLSRRRVYTPHTRKCIHARRRIEPHELWTNLRVYENARARDRKASGRFKKKSRLKREKTRCCRTPRNATIIYYSTYFSRVIENIVNTIFFSTRIVVRSTDAYPDVSLNRTSTACAGNST